LGVQVAGVQVAAVQVAAVQVPAVQVAGVHVPPAWVQVLCVVLLDFEQVPAVVQELWVV